MADEDVPPAVVDIESLDLGEMAQYARTATFASNWMSILAADASIGVVLAVIGVAIVVWLGWAGWFVVALGVFYVGLVARRFLQWRWIRRQAGLS